MTTTPQLQRTDEWFLARKARFTASEILDICESTQKFETAVFNKAHESMMQDITFLNMKYNDRSTTAMDWGVDYETEAREYYEKESNVKVTEVGFILYGKDAGGSPDGLVEIDNAQIEIKCPYNGAIHLRYLEMNDQKDILNYSSYGAMGKKYYYQMQCNMLINDSCYCDFISYDPRLIDFLKMKVIRVYPDDEVQKIIKDSIEKASERKQNLISDIIMKQRKIVMV